MDVPRRHVYRPLHVTRSSQPQDLCTGKLRQQLLYKRTANCLGWVKIFLQMVIFMGLINNHKSVQRD